MKKTMKKAAIMVAAFLLGTFIAPRSSAAQEKARDGRFIAYNNGTVLDTRTNLMWAAKDNGYEITWQDAKSYCENYGGGKHTDWRMPTMAELEGLYDEDRSRPAPCDKELEICVATELIVLTCSRIWASETRGSDAANFGFATGVRHWNAPSYILSRRALPVRSGK